MAETVFQGTSAIALDAKGRITVPVRQRDLLMQACEGRLTLTKHPDGYLWVLPRQLWETTRERLMSMSMDADPWRRVFLGSAVDVEIDGSARVLVPPELRAAAGLHKEVLLIGNGRALELWDAGRHAAHESQLLTQPMPVEIRGFVLR
ncbi:MAG: division/cell wall cluster transcriptional repressor MraZ [Rubrivivax sp.]